MRVKLFTPICSAFGSFQAGNEAELPEAIAQGLIGAGYAVSLEVVKPVEVKPAIAIEPVAEVKAEVKADKRRRKK